MCLFLRITLHETTSSLPGLRRRHFGRLQPLGWSLRAWKPRQGSGDRVTSSGDCRKRQANHRALRRLFQPRPRLLGTWRVSPPETIGSAGRWRSAAFQGVANRCHPGRAGMGDLSDREF